jgi:hypothetical protein
MGRQAAGRLIIVASAAGDLVTAYCDGNLIVVLKAEPNVTFAALHTEGKRDMVQHELTDIPANT